MKKFTKVIACTLTFVMLFSCSTFVFADFWSDLWGKTTSVAETVVKGLEAALKEAEKNRIKVKCVNMTSVDGKPLKDFYIDFDANAQPVIFNGRTMLPIRAVAEAIGYSVEWDGKNQVVTLRGAFDKKGGNKEANYLGYNQAKSLSNLFKTRYTKGPDKSNSYGFLTKANVNGEANDVLNAGAAVNIITLKIGSTYGYTTLRDNGLAGWFYEFEGDDITLKYTMDTPPIVVNGRTLIPLRAAGEMMGLDVSWDNETRTVILKAKTA